MNSSRDSFYQSHEHEAHHSRGAGAQFGRRVSTWSMPESRAIGAALVCYMVDPVWKKLYFLVGREKHTPGWPEGSDRWSNFGGRAVGQREDPEITAAREFFEETMGMVRFFFDESPLPLSSHHDIANALKSGQYTMRLTVIVDAGSQLAAPAPQRGPGPSQRDPPAAGPLRLEHLARMSPAVQGERAEPRKSYVLYVRQVPWDPACVGRFRSMRHNIIRAMHGEDLRPHVLAHPAVSTRPSLTVHRDFMEKRDIALWSIPKIKDAIRSGGAVNQRHGSATEQCRSSFLKFMEIVVREMSAGEPSINEDATTGAAW